MSMFIYPMYPLKKILWPDKGLESVRCFLSQRFLLTLGHAFIPPFCLGPLSSVTRVLSATLPSPGCCVFSDPDSNSRVPATDADGFWIWHWFCCLVNNFLTLGHVRPNSRESDFMCHLISTNRGTREQDHQI